MQVLGKGLRCDVSSQGWEGAEELLLEEGPGTYPWLEVVPVERPALSLPNHSSCHNGEKKRSWTFGIPLITDQQSYAKRYACMYTACLFFTFRKSSLSPVRIQSWTGIVKKQAKQFSYSTWKIIIFNRLKITYSVAFTILFF